MQPEAPTPYALTIADAVRFSGLTRSALYKLMGEQRLAPRKIGRRTLLLTEELRRVIADAPPAQIRRSAAGGA